MLDCSARQKSDGACRLASMTITRLTLGWMFAVSALGCAPSKDPESPEPPGAQTESEQSVEAEAEVDGEDESSSQSESQSEEGD